MKKMKFFKKLIPVFLLLAGLATLSSCNRGVGCPNNFSIGQAVETLVDVVPVVLSVE